MITRIQVMNYKSLRCIDIPMSRFHVLVGPNASGKSAFLDVLSFLHDFISEDLDFAVEKRTENFYDLVWGQSDKSGHFEMAIEAEIPTNIINLTKFNNYVIRYELSIGMKCVEDESEIFEEKLFFRNKKTNKNKDNIHTIITKNHEISEPYLIKINKDSTNNNFTNVVYHEKFANYVLKQENISYTDKGIIGSVGPRSSNEARGPSGSYMTPSKSKISGLNVLSDDKLMPYFFWFKSILLNEIQLYYHENSKLKSNSKPGASNDLEKDGSNLSKVIRKFEASNPDIFNQWICHLKTALPDLESMHTYHNSKDGSLVLKIKYSNNIKLPARSISDGTLRLLALTLPAYLPDNQGVYMFEEPENGIHPQAIETVIDSLKSFYKGQVFITTHSPLILSLVKPEEILCFWNDSEKGTRITTGDKHPVFQEWEKNKDTSLGVLFASGILDSDWGDDERSSSAGL